MDQHSLALGSFDRRVYFVDSRNLKKIQCYIKQSTGTGVTQVKYTSDGRNLIVGSRRDNNVSMWDTRNLREAFVKYQLQKSDTCSETN